MAASNRVSLVFLATALLWACDSRSPTRPTPVVNPVPVSAPQPSLVHIAGLVRDEGDRPIDGADLKFYMASGPVVTTTDGSGKYELTLEARPPGLEVAVQRAGYESSWYWASVPAATEVSRNFRLHAPRTINAGDSVRLSIILDDPSCGFDLEYRCRRVVVRSTSAGTLTLEALPDRPAVALGIAIRDVQYPMQFVSRRSIPVEAGSETPVLVLLYWPWPDAESLALYTRLEPN